MSLEDLGVLKLKAHVVEKIWGGDRLRILKNLSPEFKGPIGETLEVSLLKGFESKVGDQNLSHFCTPLELPFLIKYIDAKENLSIQVHPDDEYAKKNEGQLGKTECWLILDAVPGAGIYLGLANNVSPKTFKKAIESGDDVSRFLQFYPVKPGDFFVVPAGTLHAIGKDVFLAEVQQSSGLTYRVWDWNRVTSSGASRELHIDKAMDVINFGPEANTLSYFKHKENLFGQNQVQAPLYSHPDFDVQLVSQLKGESFKTNLNNKRAKSIICLDGHLSLELAGKKFEIEKYQSILLKQNPGTDFVLNSKEDSRFLFVS